MNSSYKIRLLLFLLTLTCAVTALTLHLTFKKADILTADAHEIEDNLHVKEKIVNQFLEDKQTYHSLKTIGKSKDRAEKIISALRNNHQIFLFTYHNHKLAFWGANRIVPSTDAGLKEGSNFVIYNTGYFEAVKKSEGNFSAVCYIPVKYRYPFENQYLRNTFSPDLIQSDNLDIATLADKRVSPVRNLTGKYLFSVKLRQTIENNLYPKFELWVWLLTILIACIFMNHVCEWIASKGHTKFAILTFLIFFLLFRIVSLQYNWFGAHFNLRIFDTAYHSGNFFFTSIGDFLLNALSVTWFLSFAYKYRYKIKLSDRPLGRAVSCIIFVLLGAIVLLIAVEINNVFYGLVRTSGNKFDVTNIINLNYFSWLGILLLCISLLNIYILLDIVLAIGASLNITKIERLIIFLTGVALISAVKLIINQLDLLFLLFAAVIFIRGWTVYMKNDEFNMGIIVTTILVFAIISSVKLIHFQNSNELEHRKLLSRKLESANDPNAVLLFQRMEKSMLNDKDIIEFFIKNDYSNLKNKLQKIYFDGYLTRYELTSIPYTPAHPFKNIDSSRAVGQFKNLVISGAIKVSEYFYHVTNTFGSNNYFAILPVKQNGYNLGTLFIELKSKTVYDPGAFPKVLIDGNINYDEYQDYSFAFYKDGKLIGQYGDYIYNLLNNDFAGKLKKFVFSVNNGYSHLAYKPNAKTLIIISKPETSVLMHIASVSFLFLVLLAFFTICIIIIWLWKNFFTNINVFRNFRWNLLISNNRVLYKTRIQISMIAAVVTTLVLVGVITYFSIRLQYQEQQQQSVMESVKKISKGFEKKMFKNGQPEINEEAFSEFADFNAVDLNYFDISGKLIYTTQPKIYDYELTGRQINTLAYINLHNLHQSEYLNTQERVGQLQYICGYKPIRNADNETIGYLGLPYFSNVHDIESRIGQFVNTLINVYALVFVAIGFFAVFVANQITAPLTLVQKSLSQTKIGRKNEPIIWKRNDEIGSLIKEYNNMIAALEESALRLASSERETAWKEMAKQVAHEIKNPLTPLKLGVQLLEKSWRENDPNFNKKFEKFSKSFIEQIESLSHIASEFSNFAKMPETSLESVLLREIIERSIEVYSKLDHITISMDDKIGPERMIKGDKDQLLRCFNNLIKNAIEAIPENRKGHITILMEQKDMLAHIQISDNGKGIPEGLRQRIFNPNFTTKSSGTGLGLAFVKQAIENMTGTISFETEHDKGTTFFITLPLAS